MRVVTPRPEWLDEGEVYSACEECDRDQTYFNAWATVRHPVVEVGYVREEWEAMLLHCLQHSI